MHNKETEMPVLPLELRSVFGNHSMLGSCFHLKALSSGPTNTV